MKVPPALSADDNVEALGTNYYHEGEECVLGESECTRIAAELSETKSLLVIICPDLT